MMREFFHVSLQPTFSILNQLTLVWESQEVGLSLEHLHAGASYSDSAEVPLFRQSGSNQSSDGKSAAECQTPWNARFV